MHSINNISIAINSLFLDIIDPMTLGLNKSEFLKTYRNTIFRFENRLHFEFQLNPMFRFDSKELLLEFLNKEKELSEKYMDYSNKEELEEMMDDIGSALTVDDFHLNYSIEIDRSEALVVFNTNSLVFKYEVIG